MSIDPSAACEGRLIPGFGTDAPSGIGGPPQGRALRHRAPREPPAPGRPSPVPRREPPTAAPRPPVQVAGVLVALTLALLALLASPAAAHERSVSYSSWEIRGRRAKVTVRITELELSRLPWGMNQQTPDDASVGTYLEEHLRLVAGGSRCSMTVPPRRLASPPGRAAFEWTLECPEQGELAIATDLLLDVAPSHLHFARVSRDGARPLERVLAEGETRWQLGGGQAGSSSPQAGTSLGEYVLLGIEHIWTGYDHLAFLLALLLLGGSLREMAKIVTGFTVAHSLTLGLAVLGYLQPRAPAIEALIGLSIAMVAAENLWLADGRRRGVPWALAVLLSLLAAGAARGWGNVPALTMAGLALFTGCYFELLERAARPVRLRWAVAFIFGLIHGFGFAGVLAEAHLPPERLVAALFGFNLGVEVGQLVIVAAVWPLLNRLARWDGKRYDGAGLEATSAAVCALGVYWFVVRAYG